jgi:hypothetical protein
MKSKVLKHCKNAYCVKLLDGSGWLVWPERGCRPRGHELCAIGFGKTPALAWRNALSTIRNNP